MTGEPPGGPGTRVPDEPVVWVDEDVLEREADREPPFWRRGAVPVLLGILVVLVIVGGVAALWVQRQIDPPGEPGAEVAIEVPEGASAASIGDLLAEQGVISNATVWRWYIRVKGTGSLNAGRFTLREGMAFGAAIDVLQGEPEVDFETVTVREGLWLAETLEVVAAGVERFELGELQRLVASGEIRSEFQNPAVQTLEGLLFPETYRVDEGETEADLLRRMVGLLDRTATELGYADSEARVGLTPYQTIIVASLVESEARVPEDRARIARVVYNRLADGQNLEIDASVIFALGERVTRVLFRDLEVDSPYNTYRNPGLPPTPIAAPGRASLEAAINPDEGPWKYYVVIDSSGRHAFAETFEEHQANIRQAERNGVR